MRLWSLVFLAMTAAGILTAATWVSAEETPSVIPLIHPESEVQVQAPKLRMWELDGALFKSLSSLDPNQLGTARLLVRRFLNESLSVGADFRYWPRDSYPLSEETGNSTWALGGSGQLYLFRSGYIGGYVGASLLWVPIHSEATFAPEVGFKWFASQRFAVGFSYWILTDVRSYTLSFEPAFNGKSRQTLGLELSVYL